MSIDNQLKGNTDRARVGGSGFTVFRWNSQPILYAQQISHQSAQPVAPPSAIHPMDTAYPVEIITSQAASMGTITLRLYEHFGSQVWEQLSGLGRGSGRGPVDIVGVMKAVANAAKPIQVFKYIRPPSIRGKKMPPYTEEYHNVVISSIEDGEIIEIGTMEVLKTIEMNYTHITRGGRNNVLNDLNMGRDSGTNPPTSYR